MVAPEDQSVDHIQCQQNIFEIHLAGAEMFKSGPKGPKSREEGAAHIQPGTEGAA